MTEPRQPSFTFAKVAKFTGKIQYRVDDMEASNTHFGVFKRGEVKEVQNKGVAIGLVENGDYAHVAADTPVGVQQSVIDEHSPKKQAAPSSETPAPVGPETPTLEGSDKPATAE